MTRIYSREEVRSISIRARRALGGVVHGETRTQMRGFQGLEFADFREYEPGDDVSRIDWNVTARLGKPWVRTYLEGRGHPVLLLVDVSSSMHFGRRALPARAVINDVAARLASAATWNGCETGLLLFADKVKKHVPCATGIFQLSNIVRELERTLTDEAVTNLAGALDYVEIIRQRRCLIFLLSDFICGDFTASLRRCALRHEIVAIGVEDSGDVPDCGLLNLRDPETGLLRQIDTASPGARAAFDQMAQTRREQNAECFRKAGVDWLQLDADRNYIGSLVAFLHRRSG